MSRFTRFTTTEAHIKQGSSNPGELSVQLNGTTATTPTLVGKQVYYLVVSGTDNTTVASSLSTVRQFGIFYLDKASANGHAADWAFPDDNDITAQPTVDIADLTVSNAGTSLLGGGFSHVVIGSFGPDHSDTHTAAFNFELAAIPEPSVGVLVMLASAGLLDPPPADQFYVVNAR